MFRSVASIRKELSQGVYQHSANERQGRLQRATLYLVFRRDSSGKAAARMNRCMELFRLCAAPLRHMSCTLHCVLHTVKALTTISRYFPCYYKPYDDLRGRATPLSRGGEGFRGL